MTAVIITGSPNVTINGLPAARKTDLTNGQPSAGLLVGVDDDIDPTPFAVAAAPTPDTVFVSGDQWSSSRLIIRQHSPAISAIIDGNRFVGGQIIGIKFYANSDDVNGPPVDILLHVHSTAQESNASFTFSPSPHELYDVGYDVRTVILQNPVPVSPDDLIEINLVAEESSTNNGECVFLGARVLWMPVT